MGYTFISKFTSFCRKLVEAVREEIYGERRMKIKERQQKIKIKEHHKRILDLNLQTDVVSTDEEEFVVTKQEGVAQIKKLPLISSTSTHSLVSFDRKDTSSKNSQKSSRSKKSPGVSYTVPLGEVTQSSKKIKKKRRHKKVPVVKSWMAKVTV